MISVLHTLHTWGRILAAAEFWVSSSQCRLSDWEGLGNHV